jgi:hypothetical protein
MRNIRYALALGGTLLAGTAAAQVPTTPPPTPPAGQTPPSPPPAGQTLPPGAPVTPQTTPAPKLPEPYGTGLRVNLSSDGAKYLRFITWHQVWVRYNENNSNTLRAPSKPESSQLDFGLRRSRLLILAQLNTRFLIYTHLGINNQNAVSGGASPTVDGKKPQVFIHDAVTEYRVNKYLSLGAGLHYYNGISRMTNASTLNILTLDVPQTNWPTIEQSDQFARWLGVYAKGTVGKFNYRVSMSDPFLTNLSSTPLSLGTANAAGTANTGTNVAQYNPQNTSHVYQGYFSYDFLESEPSALPYMVGSYLGTKRVFNIGAGFLYNKDGMYSRPTSSVVALPLASGADPFAVVPTQTHDIRLFGADVFYDSPLGADKKLALTVYGVYYNFNFGPNYVRYVGGLNPGYGAVATRGNAVPQSGTGHSAYLQAGLLLPKGLIGQVARLQPYAAFQRSSYEGLRAADGDRQAAKVLDLGANILLDGHNAKLTLNYRSRPDFTNVNDIKYRPEVTLQTMVFL